jgi:hypothetical protein
VICIPNVEQPDATGVPVIDISVLLLPATGTNVRPVGSVPEVICHV